MIYPTVWQHAQSPICPRPLPPAQGLVARFRPRRHLFGRIARVTSLLLALLGASGCMSLEHLIDREQKLQMYGGVKSSVTYIEDEGTPYLGTLVRIFDLPLTAIMDTLLLPISAPVELTRG